MSPAFSGAVAVVFAHEGGFVSNAADRGGPTNMGITLAVLSTYLKRAATVADVRELTRETACAVYESLFWGPFRLEEVAAVAPLLVSVVFDQLVLSGAHATISRLQQALQRIAVTGAVGPQTLEALRGCDEIAVGRRFITQCLYGFFDEVKKRPSQFAFLEGWVMRLMDLQSMLVKTPLKESA